MSTPTDLEGAPSLLTVKDLRVSFPRRRATVNAVDGVSLSLGQGEILGLVGESGSGKSTLAMATMCLVPKPGQIVAGEIRFLDRDLLALSRRGLRSMHGREMGLIVQDALAAMNPVTTVEEQVGEVVRDHEGGRWSAIRERVLTLLTALNIRQSRSVLLKHAHELSGGMQQRVVMAGALILGPKLLVADEPTTSLDVTVQAQILDLLRSIREKTGTGILFVSHDLATVAELCDRVMVMYAGRIIEEGGVEEVFESPIHPYTRALLDAIPVLSGTPPPRLRELGGSPPDPANWPAGCRFHPRCPLRKELGSPDICVDVEPEHKQHGDHRAACHFADPSRRSAAATSGHADGIAPS